MRSGSAPDGMIVERKASLLALTGIGVLLAIVAVLAIATHAQAAGALSATSITAGTTAPLQSDYYRFTFTPATAWPVDGMFVATFPAGYDVSQVSSMVTSSCDGSFTRAISNQVVTVTRTAVGNTPCSGAGSTVTLGNVKNPGTGVYAIAFKTQKGDATDLDTAPTTTAPVVAGQLAGFGGNVAVIVPGSSVAGALTTYQFNFAVPNSWPADGQFVMNFPVAYDVSGPMAPTGGSCAVGGMSVSVTGQAVTATRTGGSACPNGGTATVTLAGIRNPGVSGLADPIVLRTTTTLGATIDQLGRVVSDGVTTTGTPTIVTSATAAFVNAASPAGDIGRIITGAGIPAGTTIAAWNSATSVTISNPATAAATGVTFAFGETRQVTDAAMAAQPTLTGTGTFTQADVGRPVIQLSGPPVAIRGGTFISAVASASSVTLASANTLTSQAGPFTVLVEQQGVFLTPGAISAISITPTNAVAGATTSYVFQFTAANALPKDGKILLNFGGGPYDTGVAGSLTATSSCAGTYVVTHQAPSILSITRTGTTACPSGVMTFTIAGIKNPGFAGPQSFGVGQLITMTAASQTIDTNPAAVATANGINIVAGTLLTTTISAPTSLQAGSRSQYQFGFTLANDWPGAASFGTFVMTFPAGYDAGAVTNAATATMTGCNGSLTSAAASGQSVTLTRAGGASICPAGTAVILVYGTSGCAAATDCVKNPPFSGPSGAIAFRTTTSTPADIDKGTGSVTLIPGVLTPVSVVPLDLHAGSVTAYTVTFGTTSIWPGNGGVIIIFPAGVDLTGLNSAVGRSGNPCTSGGTMTAVASAQVVTITRSGGADCPANSVGLALILTGIRNPPLPGPQGFTWMTTLSTGVGIDKTADLPASPTLPPPEQRATYIVADFVPFVAAPIAGTTNPAASSATVSVLVTPTPATPVAGGLTSYAFRFTLANPWPADGRLVLAFPSVNGLGYTLTGATATVAGCDGALTTVVGGQLLTMTRSGATACALATAVTVTVAGIRNPAVSGVAVFAPAAPAAARFFLTTQTATAAPIDQGIQLTLSPIPTPAYATPEVSVLPAALTAISVSPDNVAAGTTPVTYQFQFTTANPFVVGGAFRVTLPFSGASATSPATVSGCSGTWTVTKPVVVPANTVLLVTRSAAGSDCPVGPLSFAISGITNPSGATSNLIQFQTEDATNKPIDSGSVSIALGPLTPTLIFAQDSSPNAITTYTAIVSSSSTWPLDGRFELQFPSGFLNPRTITDGSTTNGGFNLGSTTSMAAFTSADVGKRVAGAGIPPGATIASITNPQTAVMSLSATVTAAGGVTVTVSPIPTVTTTGCTSGLFTADLVTPNTIRVTRDGTGAPCPPGSISITVGQVTNPATRGRIGGFEVRFADSTGHVFEDHAGTAFITQPARQIAAPNTVFSSIPANATRVLLVVARDSGGNGVPGVQITWAKTSSGAGTLAQASSTSDDSGIATTTIQLSNTAAPMTVTATATGLTNSPITFSINSPGVPPNGGTATATLRVTPSLKDVSADVGQVTVTAVAFDAVGNNQGDVTGTTIFGVMPDGACTANVCAFAKVGAHTITGTYLGLQGTRPVNVTIGVAKTIAEVAATSSNLAPGGAQSVQAKVTDANGNPVAGVTVLWTVGSGGGSIAPSSIVTSATGIASATLTTGVASGINTAIATVAGLAGSPLSITVTTATPSTLSAVTATFTVPAGTTQKLEVTVKDASGKGVAGAKVSWSSSGVASLSSPQAVTDSSGLASITVQANIAGTLTVTATSAGVSTPVAFTLQVVRGPLDHLTVSPAQATVSPGVPQTFTVTGADAFGNTAAIPASGVVFQMSGGSCTANACVSSTAGQHMVTASSGSTTGTASLLVTGGPAGNSSSTSAGASSSSGKGTPSVGIPVVALAFAALVALVRRRQA